MMIVKNIRKMSIMIGMMLLVLDTPLFGEDGNLFLFTYGPAVTNVWPLGTEPIRSLWSNSQFGLFSLWSDSWHLNQKYGTLTFKAVTFNDLTLGISTINPGSVVAPSDTFYAELTSRHNFYELFVGVWGSAIVKGALQEEEWYPVSESDIGLPLVPNTENAVQMLIEYKVILYRDHNHNRDALAIFCLNPNDQQWEKLVEYHKPEFPAGPRWFSLSSWEQNVFYTDVETSPSTQLPGKYLQH